MTIVYYAFKWWLVRITWNWSTELLINAHLDSLILIQSQFTTTAILCIILLIALNIRKAIKFISPDLTEEYWANSWCCSILFNIDLLVSDKYWWFRLDLGTLGLLGHVWLYQKDSRSFFLSHQCYLLNWKLYYMVTWPSHSSALPNNCFISIYWIC